MTGSRDARVDGIDALWYGGSSLCWVLLPLSFFFRCLVALRRMAYRLSWLRSFDVGVPVIVVGNLTVGGTGKTPLVIWLAQRLSARNLRIGIICRGYGGSAQHWPVLVDAGHDVGVVGDEASLLVRRGGSPVAAGPDRVVAARALLESHSLDVILSDDGLQHYRLKRCFEIVVIDGMRGFGNGFCLPAGPLREPPKRLREVDAVVVNDGDFAPAPVRALRVEVRVRHLCEITSDARRTLDDFAGRSVHAVAAIGNPGRFFDLLTRHGLAVDAIALRDHARLTSGDLRFDDDWPVLITEKDAVKCEALQVENVWCVVMDLEFEPGDGEWLEREVLASLERSPENR